MKKAPLLVDAKAVKKDYLKKQTVAFFWMKSEKFP